MRLILIVSKLIVEVRLCLLESGFPTRALRVPGPAAVRHLQLKRRGRGRKLHVSTFDNYDCGKTSWEVESVMNFKQIKNKRFLNF